MLIAGLMMAAKGFAFPLNENIQKMQMLIYGRVLEAGRGGAGTAAAAVLTGRVGTLFSIVAAQDPDTITDEKYMEKVKKILEYPSHWSKYSDLKKTYMVALCSQNILKRLDDKMIDRSKKFLGLIARIIEIPNTLKAKDLIFTDRYSGVFPKKNGFVEGYMVEREMSQWNGYPYDNFNWFMSILSQKIDEDY